VQVTLIVAIESTDGDVLDISARPKLKTGALIWQSAGRNGQSICGGSGGFGLRGIGLTDWAKQRSGAQTRSNRMRLIGM
jgi:hypothetical protein